MTTEQEQEQRQEVVVESATGDLIADRNQDRRFAARMALNDEEPADLWNRHRQVALLSSSGMSNVDIASELGITPRSVSRIINSTPVRRHIAKIQSDMEMFAMEARAKVMATIPKAIAVLQASMDDDKCEGMELHRRAKLAIDLLKLTGVEAPNRTQIQGQFTHTYMTPEMIEMFKAKAMERVREAGMDAE